MKTIIISLKIFLFFTLLTGIVYPLFITGLSQVLFPQKANGSLILKDGKIVGSSLIGQMFDTTIYFSSRPSAVSYNPLPSGGSNFGLTNHKQDTIVRNRMNKFISDNNLPAGSALPSEMVFASASGLDPHISPEAAMLQVERISRVRHFSAAQIEKLEQLVRNQVENRQMVVLGEPRVNVLLLNLRLENIQ